MQETGTPDLTRLLPWWIPYIPYALFGVWYVVQTLRKGTKARRQEQAGEIAAAVKGEKERADLAESVASLYKDKAERFEHDLEAAEREKERLHRKLEERAEIEDELQRRVVRQLGEIEKLEERLRAIESGKSSHS